MKKKMGPIEKSEMIHAYGMLVPTVLIVLLIVLFPLFASFWISFKDVSISDLRKAEIKVTEKFSKKPKTIDDISIIEYKFNNFSKSTSILNVSFTDNFPEGIKALDWPKNCKVDHKEIKCFLGDFKPKDKKKLKIQVVAQDIYFNKTEKPKDSKPIVLGKSKSKLYNLNLNFKNFTNIFSSPDFWPIIKVSFLYSFFSASGSLFLGILAALLLTSTFPGRGIIRGIFLFPYIAPIIAVTITWVILLDPFFGTVNAILKELNIINVPIHFFGIRDIDILFLGLEFKFPVALTFVILFESWRYFPLAMLFILARLQSVPTELFEAADIDGATPIQKFKFITWPLILSIIFILFLLRFIWTFNKFDDIFLLTGGSSGTKTLTVNVYETGFNIGNLGAGAANAVLVFLILIISALIIIKLSPKE